MKKGELTVTAYFTKLKSIWEQLNGFRLVPNCVMCSETCECRMAEMREYRDENYTVRLLQGLNEQYSNVRSNIMLINPLPDVNTTFSLLTQQERQFGIMDPNDYKALLQSAQINYVDGAGSGRGREGN
ncbi:hypothetical protein AHAS_Ahas18G0192100 [Arachis hypogaea]